MAEKMPKWRLREILNRLLDKTNRDSIREAAYILAVKQKNTFRVRRYSCAQQPKENGNTLGISASLPGKAKLKPYHKPPLPCQA